MKIFAVALNMHDHNTYDGVTHIQEERFSRRKHNIFIENPHCSDPSRDFFKKYFVPKYSNLTDDDIIACSCSNLGKEFTLDLLTEQIKYTDFLKFKPQHMWDHYFLNKIYFIDHHQSHAAYAFLSSGLSESDILSIDGQGPNFTCIFVNKQGKIIDLSATLSIGGFWNLISQCLDFGYLGAGKVMGLAGYGKFNEQIKIVIEKYLKNPIGNKLPEGSHDIIKSVPKEDVAYTLQQITNELITQTVFPLKTSNNICLAGGVAYNGYLNELFTKYYDNVHVPPAVGDEGQSLGTYMHADYVLNKNIHIPNVYSGKNHEVDISLFTGLDYVEKPFNEIAKEVAKEISNGKIVGWYQEKSESGNRALGNRSILADPRNPNIKNIINSTIKLREDFRPFAPSVLEEYYRDYFDTNQTSPYMSRIVPVISDKIPGVTHVDGTARIQTVNRTFNQRFYDLINEFYKITGIPMLLNTSFNCREPIVETPLDAINTLKKCDLDILVIDNFVIRKKR